MQPFFKRAIVRRFVGLVGVAIFAAGGAFAGNAGANHTSTDVATGTFFHNSVGWLIGNGVATGFQDGTFRTNANITRGQASFWFGNYNDSFELVTKDTFSGTGNSLTGDATCPAGKRAVAGGGRIDANNVMITGSRPVNQNTWEVIWERENDVPFVSNTPITNWALCMPLPVGAG